MARARRWGVVRLECFGPCDGSSPVRRKPVDRFTDRRQHGSSRRQQLDVGCQVEPCQNDGSSSWRQRRHCFCSHVGIAVVNEDTRAILGTSPTSTWVGGNLTLNADHTGSNNAISTGDAEGGDDANIAAAMAMSFVNEVTEVTTNRNLTVAGNLSFLSTNASNTTGTSTASATGADDSNTSNTDQQASNGRNTANGRATSSGARGTGSTASPSASTSSDSIDVSAAFALNVVNSRSSAFLPTGRNFQVTGVSSIRSTSNVDGLARADASTTKPVIGVLAWAWPSTTHTLLTKPISPAVQRFQRRG